MTICIKLYIDDLKINAMKIRQYSTKTNIIIIKIEEKKH